MSTPRMVKISNFWFRPLDQVSPGKNILSIFGSIGKSERTSLVLKNIAASFLGRGLNVLSTIALVPITISALGPQDYGVLMALASTMTFFNFSDFGLGSSLVTELADAEARNDMAAAVRLVTQVWCFLLTSAISVVLLGAFAYHLGLIDRLLATVPAGSFQWIWSILALLWQIRFDGVGEGFLTMRTSL